MNNLKVDTRQSINEIVECLVAAGDYNNDNELEVRCINKIIQQHFGEDILIVVDYTKLKIQLEMLKRDLGINCNTKTIDTSVLTQLTNDLKEIRKNVGGIK